MKWKLFSIALINVLIAAAGIKLVLACADPGTPYDDLSYFQNNINGHAEFEPFYYTTYTPLYDDYWSFDAAKEDQLADGNIEEWFTLAKGTATRADIDSFMNRFSEGDVKTIFNKNSNPTVKSNTFSRFLSQKDNRKYLEYLLFAKKCEPYNMPKERLWDDANYGRTPPPVLKDGAAALINEGTIAYMTAKNDFLKWRYAFQVLRLSEYGGKYDLTLSLYDKLVGTRTAKNVMYPKCIGLKAGALYHKHKLKEAAYLYTRAFDLSDDMKRSAYCSFLWATDTISLDKLVPLCKNDHEKAVLAVMDGLYERSRENFEGLAILEKAYKLDPNVRGMDVIMTREVNKAEQGYLFMKEQLFRQVHDAWAYDNFLDNLNKQRREWKSKDVEYNNYLQKLTLFAQKIASDPRTNDKAFWLLSSSYLCFMTGRYPECKNYLNLAGMQKMTTREHDVHGVIDILYVVNANSTITPEVEAALLPSMKWLDKRRNEEWRYGRVYWGMLNNVFTDKYMLQKDTVKAVYCLARASIMNNGSRVVDEDYMDDPGTLLENMSLDKLHELQNFVKKKDKTDFEKWLTEGTPYSLSVLKELEGTKYIREMKFDKAVSVLSGISDAVLANTVLPDVLVSHLQDSQDWNASDSQNTYNKLQFAEKMLELEKKLDKNPDNARAAYQYANGLYNMSYYGKAHHAFDYYRSTGDDNAYYNVPNRKKLPEYRQEYYGLQKALKYYMVAYEHEDRAEIKARCLFMAAKCWQKNCPTAKNVNKYDDGWEHGYYLNALKNSYLARLHKEYKNTTLYTEAFTSCSYFRDYVHNLR